MPKSKLDDLDANERRWPAIGTYQHPDIRLPFPGQQTEHSGVSRALIYPLVICLLGAALEGLFAGGGIRQRLKDLRLPAYAVPFWGWMIIGAAYYLICFTVLHRLFLLPPAAARGAAFALLGAIMLINALWNYFFFRSRNLFHAYLLGLPYSAVAISLFLVLFLKVDHYAAWIFLPYLVYLCYANIWGYRLWKLNKGAMALLPSAT